MRAGLSWRRASRSSGGISAKASLVGARTVKGPSEKTMDSDSVLKLKRYNFSLNSVVTPLFDRSDFPKFETSYNW